MLGRPKVDAGAAGIGKDHDWKERAVESSLFYTCKSLSLYDLTLSIFGMTEQLVTFGLWHATRQDKEKVKQNE